ncbi:BolA family transcriptional regulator [bacterium]|nr:BolA family transcriptional regulator [bacterium]
MVEEIKNVIQDELPQSTVYVFDPNQDGQHFEALVIDKQFESLSLVNQHKLVMNALKLAFATSVHALGLKTFTPKKWDAVKDQYIK